MSDASVPGSDAWYALPGKETDVVLSTKVTVSRNLANFPFPKKLHPSDAERVQSLVFDAINNMDNGGDFHAVSVEKLDSLGKLILQERGVLPDEAKNDAGVVIRNDGKVSCSVNVVDHVRISTFASGFNFDSALEDSRVFDEGLQKKLQFAASYDFGYLTSNIMDAGSGMKLLLRLHLPSLSLTGKIAKISSELSDKGMFVAASYGAGGFDYLSGNQSMGGALGCYYDISLINSQSGTEFDQVTSLVSEITKLKELERAARAECREKLPTMVRNWLYRSVALARNSMYIPVREAVNIISGVKLGRDMNLVTGIDDVTLHALLYRIQEGHLEYVLRNGSFTFDKDIQDSDFLKKQRLRALILQEAFDDIKTAM